MADSSQVNSSQSDNSQKDSESKSKGCQDAVVEAFVRTRRFAAEHGGAPDIAAPSSERFSGHFHGRRRQGWSEQNTQSGHIAQSIPNIYRDDARGSTPKARKLRGFPTGKDGRRLPRSLEMTPIGQVWMKEVTDRGWAPHLVAAYLAVHWEDIVGSHVASYSQVTQVEDRVATVICETDAWATNLRYFQSQILKNIAEKFGDQVICELRIHGPSYGSTRAGRRYSPRGGSGRR